MHTRSPHPQHANWMEQAKFNKEQKHCKRNHPLNSTEFVVNLITNERMAAFVAMFADSLPDIFLLFRSLVLYWCMR